MRKGRGSCGILFCDEIGLGRGGNDEKGEEGEDLPLSCHTPP